MKSKKPKVCVEKETGTVTMTEFNPDGSVMYRNAVKQGGLSRGVWWNSSLQRYITDGHPFGYVGHSRRTRLSDVVVESGLREQGLSDEGIAVWLTSTSGRHLGDCFEKGMTKQEVEEAFRGFFGTRDAINDLKEWDDLLRTSEKVTNARQDAALEAKLAKGERPTVVAPRHIGKTLSALSARVEESK